MGWGLVYGKIGVLAELPTKLDGYGNPGDNPDGILCAQTCAEIFHLLGDPTMRIRLQHPLAMEVTLPPVETYVEYVEMPFPPEFSGSRVAILRAGKIIGQGTVADGKGMIYMRGANPLRPGPDTVVVADREGAVPFSAELSFAESCELYCLEVPASVAGTDMLADFGVRENGGRHGGGFLHR